LYDDKNIELLKYISIKSYQQLLFDKNVLENIPYPQMYLNKNKYNIINVTIRFYENKKLSDIKISNEYGFGNIKTLSDFEEESGICFTPKIVNFFVSK
jgi:hypothetical protein